MIFEIRMDRESSQGIGMRLLAPSLNNRNLIFFGSPVPALASAKAAAGKSTLGRALQWDALAFLPHSTDTDYKLLHIHTHTDIYKYMHSSPHLRSLASVALNRQPDKRVCDQHEWLQDRMAACRSWITSPVASGVSMVYVLLLLRCFSCSHTVLPKEHSLGVIFFLLTFLMLCCIFLQFPVFLSCLSPCHICCVCMDRLMANFAGTCD